MNFLLRLTLPCALMALNCAAISPLRAQTKTTATKAKSAVKAPIQPSWKLDALPIAALPQVPVEFEFVGTQKDLLGLVQSVARGVTVADAKPASPNMSKKAQILSDADVLLLLQNIHFLRAQSFNFLKMEQNQDEERAKAPKAAGAQSMEDFMGSMNPKRPKRLDVQEFYGKAFRAQKGQRQFFSSAGDLDGERNGDTTIAIWSFETPRSWALVKQGPSRAIVVRSDGLPRLEALGRLFRLAVSSN